MSGELDRSLPPCETFLEISRFFTVTVVSFIRGLIATRCIFPGACFQRQATVMELLEVALSVLQPSEANTRSRGFTKGAENGFGDHF